MHTIVARDIWSGSIAHKIDHSEWCRAHGSRISVFKVLTNFHGRPDASDDLITTIIAAESRRIEVSK